MHAHFRNCRLIAKRSLVQGSALAAVLLGATPLAAQVHSCPPLAFPPVAIAAWDDDTSYEMTVRDVGGGQLRLTIVGDILVLDAAKFASLVRTVDKAPGNVAEIVLDARVVRVLEPLALQSGRIKIYAQTVSFEKRGVVALTRAPSGTADGLEINALEVDLRQALPLPLQLTVAQGTARGVTIRAGRLLTQAGNVTGDAASRLLWRRSTNFDGALPTSFPANWVVTVGDAGSAQAIEAMRPTAAWPAYSSYKFRKHHSLAPFDEAHKKRLTDRIDSVRPLFESLERAEVLLDIDALSLLMKRNVDRRGFGPAYVPSEDFVVAKERFAASREAARKQLPNLRTLIASAHLSPTLDVQALGKARDRIRSLSDVQTRRRTEIGDTFTKIGVLQALSVEVGNAIEFEREESRKALEDLKKKDANAANIKLATTVLAVGASFVGTPAAGAAIAAGVGVVGDLVYAHNVGYPVNVETLVSIGKKNAEMQKQILAAREAWDKHSADIGTLKQVLDGKEVIPKDAKKPLTKTDAAKKAGESASDFATKVKAVADGMGAIPKPDSVSLNQVEAENGELQKHLARMTEIQRGLSDQTAALTGLQAALAADEAAIADTRLVEQVLLELKPANDQEIVRWKTAALQLWARELQSLYQDAMDLRRSLFFETWKTPALPADVLVYPEEFTAYLAAGRYSPESPNATSPTALTVAHLDGEIAKHMAVLDAIAKAVDDAWQSYLAERAAGAQPFFDQQEFVDQAGAPPTTRLFLDQINAQIRRQILYPESRESQQFTLLIPVVMTTPPSNLPERLLRAGVVNPEFQDTKALAGKTIAFDITYRLAGELRRDMQCAYVDLTVPGGSPTATRRDMADKLPNSVRSEAEEPLTFQTLRQSRAAPPARTLYFVSVAIGGSTQDANWSTVPVLKRFTFWRRVVQ